MDLSVLRAISLVAYNPRSPYSASKAGSDHLVRAWHHTYGLPVVLSNCSNNWALAVPGEANPGGDPQSSGGADTSVWRWFERARLAVCG